MVDMVVHIVYIVFRVLYTVLVARGAMVVYGCTYSI